MLATIIILYAGIGIMVGWLNFTVEQGDPGNEHAQWLVVLRSVVIGLVWLPFTMVAAFPRQDHVLEPTPHQKSPATRI